MPQTKASLIDDVARKLGRPVRPIEDVVNCIFGAVEETLKQGGRVEIRGFGIFTVREYGAYRGRNPRSGASVSVKEKRLPFFKVGTELKVRVNAGREATGARELAG
jgi:integration host factor subunit beta